MPGSRDTPGEGGFSPGVLRNIGNKNGDSTMRSPEARRKLGAIKLFHDENTGPGVSSNSSTGMVTGKCSGVTSALSQSSVNAALRRAEAEAARYREELRQTTATLKQRNQRVQEMKASKAQSNERYTALLKNNEEAMKELAVLRSQLANDGGSTAAAIGNVERLKAAAESLESSNDLLREEKDSLAGRLAKREAACAVMKDELSAASQREASLGEKLELVQSGLETALKEEKEKAEVLAKEQASRGAGDGKEEAAWALERTALIAQVEDLEEQLAAARRRSTSLVAERAVMVEESARLRRDHDAVVASLHEELEILQRRTSADVRDWQRRHREAVAARRVVEGQLERLVGAGKSIALVGERQAALEQSLNEACGLLSVALSTEVSGEPKEVAERVVEGVIEHVLGRVFEAGGSGKDGRRGELDSDDAKEREADHELRREALAALGNTLENLTAEMEELRQCGDAEAKVYLEQAQQLGVELEGAREHHQTTFSALEAERAACAKEVERLTGQVKEVESERERLELQLETTVQLSEMALAAKSVEAAEEGQQQQEAARRAAEELEVQSSLRCEELEAERVAYTEKVNALEEYNRALEEKLGETVARTEASKTKEEMSCRDVGSQSEGFISQESEAREAVLRTVEARLAAVGAKNEELEREIASARGAAEQSLCSNEERQAKVVSLEQQINTLRATMEDERNHMKELQAADLSMRKYLIQYRARSEHKMREIQRRAANGDTRIA